ncbi:hypothetical protein [Neorhizobium sp. DT-125]|uniref:hypothetical protein n=1 Tax=Neorhizobium sp. DT-125 TaxID=3396163 RepID=UPI003F1BAD97
MSMDSSNFPFVWMSLPDDSEKNFRQGFEEFEANLKRGEVFVLLANSAPAEDREHSQEEKKYTSLWMKKHKAELRKLVLAMIVIEPSAAKRVAFKAFGMVFAKFWGYPLMLASSREEALETAEKLLSRSRKWGAT